jgi:hypothetical protein
MLTEHLWKFFTLNFVKGGGDGEGEWSYDNNDDDEQKGNMGDSCSKVPTPGLMESGERHPMKEHCSHDNDGQNVYPQPSSQGGVSDLETEGNSPAYDDQYFG